MHHPSASASLAYSPTAPDLRPRSSRLSAVIGSAVRPKSISIENGGKKTPQENETGIASPQKELPSRVPGLRRLRRRGYTNPAPAPDAAEDRPAALHSRRPSSSWLRHLSLSSFRPESPSPVPTPTSSTFGGSVCTNITRPSSQRRSSSKLLKRPSSQNSFFHPLFSRAAPPRSSTAPLRRPVTSHQKTESLPQPGPTLFETPEPSNSGTWQPYLTSTSTALADIPARPLSAPGGQPRNHGLRLVLPNADTAPALLLAPSVTEKKPGYGVETYPRVSTAPAGFHFRDPFNSVNASSHFAEVPLSPATVPVSTPDVPPETSPVSEPVSATATREEKSSQVSLPWNEDGTRASTPGSNAENVKSFSNGPLRRVRGRTFSKGGTSAEISNQEGANSDSLLPNEKRNLTDPCFFGHPPSTPPAFLDTRHMRRSVMSLSLSRTSSDMNHLQDITRHSSIADTGPLSASETAGFCQVDSSTSPPSRQRMKRLSIATSGPASTVISSDDTHTFTSGGENETDFMSETAFDSVRTYATTSSYSRSRGPRVDTIFDENAPYKVAKERLAGLDEFLPRGSFIPKPSEFCPRGPNENKSPAMASTVPAKIADENCPASAMKRFDHVPMPRSVSISSDSSNAKSLLGPLSGEANGLSRKASRVGYKDASDRQRDLSCGACSMRHSSASSSTCRIQHDRKASLDSGSKTNIFDWSEPTASDTRPSTVHGKQGSNDRGSRPPIRRAPNTLHLRSQSVPSIESSANEPLQTSTKFGTWGLGSKGVSEDWDNDFDFEESDDNAGGDLGAPNKKVGQGGMIVPQAIMERQASLHGQFGHVQELMLLVEELKRLRQQGNLLQIVHGTSSDLWKEAESIINLATINDDDNEDDHEDDNSQSPPRSPSSLTFSFDDSDEESRNVDESANRSSGGSWPQASLERADASNNAYFSQSPDNPSAKPMSVLDMIYQRRATSNPLCAGNSVSRHQKLPFDTQSLQSLVVRAGGVTRALKDVIRKAEGVATSGSTLLQPAPAFSRIFDQPSDELFDL